MLYVRLSPEGDRGTGDNGPLAEVVVLVRSANREGFEGDLDKERRICLMVEILST